MLNQKHLGPVIGPICEHYLNISGVTIDNTGTL